MRTSLRRWRAGALIVAVVLVTGGCSVTFGSDDRPASNRRVKSAKVTEVVESGSGRFDLRTPPTREEAGFSDDGSTLAVYERSGRDPFDVEVLLPGDQVLRIEADLVLLAAESMRFPTTTAPESMEIKRTSLSSEDARDQLLALAAQFDLEVEPINAWYRIADSQRIPTNDAIPNTPYLSAELGYLTLSVQGRYLPTGDTAVVAVSLFWGGAALRDRTPTPPATG